MEHTIVQAVLSHGETMPEHLAVAYKNERITYRELCTRVKNAAKLLHYKYGVQSGDLVMLSAVSKPEYVVILLGIQYLGAVSVPIDKAAKEANILDVYNFINPRLLITDAKVNVPNKISLKLLNGEITSEKINEPLAYAQPQEQAVAEILFTTGTTGKPKGAMLTYGNIAASTANTRDGVGMLPSDVVLIPLPLNHSVGMRVLRTSLYLGASIIIQNGFTFAKELENNISAFGCTGLVSVPASIEVVYRQMQDKFAEVLGKLRYIEFGAGSLSYDMKKKLTKILPKTTIINTWGSTETGGAIFLNVSKHPDKLTSLGKPAPSVRLKVVDEHGNAIQAHDINTAGRMVLQGPMQMAGYYKSPEQSAQTLVDGWLYTNDMVYTDEDDYVYMLGRADDIINVGGEKVSPIEVENIAQENESVRECACIGVDDPEGILGRVPILYVVPEGNKFEEKALVKFLAEKLEKYKLPQRYLLIDELPRNRMKKLDRKALYRMWEEDGDEPLNNAVLLNLKQRRSVRDFTDESISKSKLKAIVQAGIYAPSGHNMQTWRFTVMQKPERIARLKEVTASVAKRCGVYFYGFNEPKAVILVSNDRRNANSIQDSSCAAENIMLAASSLGIGSVWINALHAICDEPEIRTLLQEYGIPDTHIVWATLALGYPAKEAKLLAKKKNVIYWIDD